MSVAQGLAVALVRAVTDKAPIFLRVDCFVRPGYPLGPNQEFCRFGSLADPSPKSLGYGLLFIMDWSKKSIPAGSVECY
jgi:hypothetical protein